MYTHVVFVMESVRSIEYKYHYKYQVNPLQYGALEHWHNIAMQRVDH